MGKKVYVENEENVVDVKNWEELYELVEKNRDKTVVLYTESEDPEFYVKFYEEYTDVHINSNWYKVRITSKIRRLDDIVNIARGIEGKWTHYWVTKREGEIFEYYVEYRFDDIHLTVRYLSYYYPVKIDMILHPVSKILTRIHNYLKTW
mgnify:CR=1 FL=1